MTTAAPWGLLDIPSPNPEVALALDAAVEQVTAFVESLGDPGVGRVWDVQHINPLQLPDPRQCLVRVSVLNRPAPGTAGRPLPSTELT